MEKQEISQERVIAFEYDLLNATRQAEQSYWNALITFNTILISVFSAIAILNSTNRSLIVLLIISCLLSSICIISNFLSRVSIAREQGMMFHTKKLEDIVKEDEKRSKRNSRIIRNIYYKEILSVFLLIPEALIIIILVFQSGK